MEVHQVAHPLEAYPFDQVGHPYHQDVRLDAWSWLERRNSLRYPGTNRCRIESNINMSAPMPQFALQQGEGWSGIDICGWKFRATKKPISRSDVVDR